MFIVAEQEKSNAMLQRICYLLIEQNNFDGDHNYSNEGDGEHGDKNSNVVMKFLEMKA